MPEPVSIALSLYLAGYSGLRTYARSGSAVSEDAQAVKNIAARLGGDAESSEALFGARRRALDQLALIADESTRPNWDGYGAKPIDPWAVQIGERIIRSLPEDFPVPELGAEPDGSLALEWIESRYRRLILSVDSSTRLAYAWIDGSDRGHTVSGFDGVRLPDRLLADIRLMMRIPSAPLRAA